VTVQWCSLEESSTRGHPKGRHNYGLIAGAESTGSRFTTTCSPTTRAAIRPLERAGGLPQQRRLRFRDGFSHEGNYRGQPGFNIIGNYYLRGPSDPDVFPFCFEDKVPYYLRDNYIAGVGLGPGPVEGGGQAARAAVLRRVRRQTGTGDAGGGSPHAVADPGLPPGARPAGAFPRDAVTARVVADVRAGTGSWGRRSRPTCSQDCDRGVPPGTPIATVCRTRGEGARPQPGARRRGKGDEVRLHGHREYVNGLAATLIR